MSNLNADCTDSYVISECAALEYILLGDLRDLLNDEPAEGDTCKWVLAVLDALLDTLPKKFQLQSAGGYLEEVLEQYPNWYHQVEQLRDEQRQLFLKLRQLREQVAAQAEINQLKAEISNDLRNWMNRLLAHHRHQRRLVQTAFNLDVGAGD